MPLFTRRRLLAAAPVSGLALGAAVLPPATASASVGGVIRFVTPTRRIDSRIDGPYKVGTGVRETLNLEGPEDFCGVILNVTVTETEGVGYFRIADDFVEPAPTSTINWYTENQTVANMAIVSTSTSTGIAPVTVQGGGDGEAHLVIDVLGYII